MQVEAQECWVDLLVPSIGSGRGLESNMNV